MKTQDRAMTELEKIQHLTQKYRLSKRLYTVYSRAGDEGRYVFTLIYGTDNKHKAIAYVRVKEEQGLFLIAYCARPQEKSSKCVYVSGMQNSLNGHSASLPSPDPAPSSPLDVDAPVSARSSPLDVDAPASEVEV